LILIKEAVNEAELSAVIMIERKRALMTAVNAHFLGFGERVLTRCTGQEPRSHGVPKEN
jgi:hypothetical protein